MKIIIADDEPSVRTIMFHHIKKYGSPFSEYKSARNGKELVELCSGWPADIIFVDIRMPYLDGLESIAEIHGLPGFEQSSFYIMSGYSEFEYAQTALKLGVKDYLLKPVRGEQVFAILRAEEERRYVGVALDDAWRAGDEKRVAKLSRAIQKLAASFAEKQSDAFPRRLEEWEEAARECAAQPPKRSAPASPLNRRSPAQPPPIEKNYYYEKFHAPLKTFDEQLAFLKNSAVTLALSEGEVKSFRLISDFVYANFASPIFSLDALARRFGYSAPHLSALIKKEKGVNFTTWLSSLRIEKAKSLLAETDLMIKDVGAQCGYPHPSYFIKIFSEGTGMTPTEYRKRNGGKA